MTHSKNISCHIPATESAAKILHDQIVAESVSINMTVYSLARLCQKEGQTAGAVQVIKKKKKKIQRCLF